MNYIEQLGTVALASRLKNFTDLLTKDVKKIYQEQNLDFELRWFTIVRLLNDKGELPLTTIAKELNQTHPAINQLANTLEKKGIVLCSKDKSDFRKRMLKLSKKGEKVVETMFPLWNNIETAVNQFLGENQADFLQILNKLEKALQKKPMYTRINNEIDKAQYNSIEILNYNKKFVSFFKELNYEWLQHYFEVEADDQTILENPEKEIIDKGGQILFAKYDNKIVGTVALSKINDNEFELLKMAVSPEYQGRKIGKKLLDKAVVYAQQKGCNKITLYTNTKLESAVNLYQSKGFKTITPIASQLKNLKRSSIKMELTLTDY